MTDREEGIELKPCPFCGEKELVSIIHEESFDGWQPHCGECEISLPHYRSERAAANAWNRRASPAEPVAWTSKEELERIPKLPVGYACAMWPSPFTAYESGRKIEIPLYTHPPRQPAGELSDERVIHITHAGVTHSLTAEEWHDALRAALSESRDASAYASGVKAGREEAAKVCEEYGIKHPVYERRVGATECVAAIRALPSPADSGMVMVPREPTMAMMVAPQEMAIDLHGAGHDGSQESIIRYGYAKMLSAHEGGAT